MADTAGTDNDAWVTYQRLVLTELERLSAAAKESATADVLLLQRVSGLEATLKLLLWALPVMLTIVGLTFTAVNLLMR